MVGSRRAGPGVGGNPHILGITSSRTCRNGELSSQRKEKERVGWLRAEESMSRGGYFCAVSVMATGE